MIIFNQFRQSGKTTQLLKLLMSDENYIFVTYNNHERDYVRRLSTEEVAKRIFSIFDVINGKHMGVVENPVFVIDELDLCLNGLLGNVVCCTRTENEMWKEFKRGDSNE